MIDISDSGFIPPGAFSTEWQSVTLLQQRNHNMLYHAKRYGKYFVLKGLSADGQLLTSHVLQQEKEFTLGISLNHPNIAETYSLEEIQGCGRCIVIEYVDGTTLAEWLTTNPSKSARKRVMMQVLDALEYIHSLQLVHHDLKSSNILITRNGQNVKLIDFGLSELDTTNPQNDIQHDIQKFGQIIQLLFPFRYKQFRQQCIRGQFPNMAAIRHVWEKRQLRVKLLPYVVAIVILIISVLLSIRTYHLYQESEQMATVAEQYMAQKQREQEMIEKVHFFVARELEPLQKVADSISTYTLFTQHPLYMEIWQRQVSTRDSLANTYIDDPSLYHQCKLMWTRFLGEKVIQINTQVKQNKPLN